MIIGVIALISAVATPGVLNWRANTKLRSAAAELRGAMQIARSRAIQEGETVIVNLEDHSYFGFVDSGAGGGVLPNWQHDPSEPIVFQKQLPADIQLQRNVTATGASAPTSATPGTVIHHKLMQMAYGTVERGDFSVAGNLLTLADFEENKVQFIQTNYNENFWWVFYDGVTTGLTYGPGSNYPDQLVFDHDGRCLNPQFIIVVNINGQKMLLEVTRFGVAKLSPLA